MKIISTEPIYKKLTMPDVVMLGLSMLMAVPVWSQSASSSQQPVPALVGSDNSSTPADSINNETNDDRMLTPPPVTGQAYPSALTSEERSNYLHAGVSFTSAYTDNALASLRSHPVSDVSHSVAPMIALDQTTPRQQLVLTYAPGFTFYQRTSALNETDQNAAIDYQYRLSPHVTFSARDTFQKSSNVFNQPDLTATTVVYGGTQGANLSVISPIADRISNTGNVGLAYQYSRNDMVGASGTFNYLHYPNPEQVPGLFDASSQAALAFYSHRLSRAHYIGLTYQYQRLMAYPTGGENETETHAALAFYTFYPTLRFSISFFGGMQHYDTVQPEPAAFQLQLSGSRKWTPPGGVSLSWQGRLNTFSASYLHIISSGGGLVGAVQMDSVNLAFRQQLTKTLNVLVAGGYAQNNVLGASLKGGVNGQSASGTAELQQQFGQHLALQLGYTRLSQNYSNVAVFSSNPDTNREFIALSYQFSRPLGR